ncbi:Monoacylglycerol lipase ABHD12 [Trametes pubescens]|uniref:Monoacylglycerol lipase ABHD12 n=1 Tax=Trametes pubescens TaxID=154538 RepID=A0A1M2VQS4_TRAPU|nr:Monoacylglycerol lipase ABHD12 [Trametes pubescens]
MADNAPPRKPSGGGLLSKLHKFAYLVTFLYACIILLLATPFFQRHAIYQHAVRVPWSAQFDLPEKYGLAPGKTLNFKLTTPDNVTLGAWFVLSEPVFQSLRAASPTSLGQPSAQVVQEALHTNPTILYFHGNAATRAAPMRVRHYSSFTSRLRANVLVIDYRGFADSEGVPSDTGLTEDAKTAWRWLLSQGAKPEDVMLVGHSLGTGVTTRLATWLAQEGVKPRGVALLAPFTNLASAVQTYDIGGFPLLQPLQSFAIGRRLLANLMHHEFDTLAVVQDINVPLLIAHSQNDMDIPHSHSRTLLDVLLDPHLPSSPISLPATPDQILGSADYTTYIEAQKLRREKRSELVRKLEVPTFGVIEEFDGTAGKVVYVETFWGAHNDVGLQEGVQDIITNTFRLGIHL